MKQIIKIIWDYKYLFWFLSLTINLGVYIMFLNNQMYFLSGHNPISSILLVLTGFIANMLNFVLTFSILAYLVKKLFKWFTNKYGVFSKYK